MHKLSAHRMNPLRHHQVVMFYRSQREVEQISLEADDGVLPGQVGLVAAQEFDGCFVAEDLMESLLIRIAVRTRARPPCELTGCPVMPPESV